MNTSVETAAAVKPAITEADIAAFLQAQRVKHGLRKLMVFVSDYEKEAATWMVEHVAVQSFRADKSLDRAIELIKAEIKTPEQLAAAKRDAAAKLLAEADALVCGKAVAA